MGVAIFTETVAAVEQPAKSVAVMVYTDDDKISLAVTVLPGFPVKVAGPLHTNELFGKPDDLRSVTI